MLLHTCGIRLPKPQKPKRNQKETKKKPERKTEKIEIPLT